MFNQNEVKLNVKSCLKVKVIYFKGYLIDTIPNPTKSGVRFNKLKFLLKSILLKPEILFKLKIFVEGT